MIFGQKCKKWPKNIEVCVWQTVLSAAMFENFIIEAQLEGDTLNHVGDINIKVEAPICEIKKLITHFGASKPNLTLDSTA